MTSACILVTAFAILLVGAVGTTAQTSVQRAANVMCPRPTPGAVIQEPVDLRSENGVLEVHFAFRNELDASGHLRYCYVFGDGLQSPNLRLRPGDLLILTLRNDLTSVALSPTSADSNPANTSGATQPEIKTSPTDPCGSMRMSATSTNLHFHGLTIPPVCHQDDVLRTSIQPGDPPFEYRFRIPADQPPGLYWYHPHLHGFSRAQVVGGASGALIVEGIERANRSAAGLPERILVIRDQDLLNPDAQPSTTEPKAPAALLDRD